MSQKNDGKKFANQHTQASHVTLETHARIASQSSIETQLKGALGDVRALVEIYYDTQEVRIRSFNRLRQVGEVKGVNPNILRELEKQIRDYIQDRVKEELIWQTFLRGIKGIGPILSGGLISWLDPSKAKHASGFWKYCGLDVVDGRAVKREKGKKLGYNVACKVLCWKIADSFIKQRTPFYRDIYDEAKTEEASKLGNPEKKPQNCPQYSECVKRLRKTALKLNRESKKLPCKKHIDYRARRKMIKRFLLDLWVQWRRVLDLPVSEPYAVAVLGHQKQPMNSRNPELKSEPSSLRNPEAMSEPAASRKPMVASESLAIRKPLQESEPLVDREPCHASEPFSVRKPLGKSEPLLERNPTEESEPSYKRKPVCDSEPISPSNPQRVSEPLSLRKPFQESEPKTKRKPSKPSEPHSERTPPQKSEPSILRKPSLESEPAFERKPMKTSELASSRNPKNKEATP